MLWSSNLTGGVTIPATNATVMLDLASDLEADIGHNLYNATTQRFIGDFVIRTAASGTAGDQGIVSLGITFVDRDQSNVPDPNDDHYDWLWLRHIPVNVHPDHATNGGPAEGGFVRIDAKSRRRMRQTHQKLVLLAAHDNALASNPTLVGGIRTLFAL